MHSQITPSSGNVFADMGHPHPQKALVKAKLASRIATVIEERGLTREEAAKLFGMAQPEEVSLVVTGRLGKFTIDQLADFLTALNEDVEITVRHTQGPAQLHVTLG
jgi:predicted XRE-type DNA-binding protein